MSMTVVHPAAKTIDPVEQIQHLVARQVNPTTFRPDQARESVLLTNNKHRAAKEERSLLKYSKHFLG